MDYRNRRGKFTINRIDLTDLNTSELRSVMRDMIIFHMESNYATDQITYYAIHPDFDEVHNFLLAPEYDYTPLKQKKWTRKQ